MMIDGKRVKFIVSIILAVMVFLLAFLVLRPIFLSVIAGLILAYVLFPVHLRLKNIVKNKNVSSLIICIILLLLIVIPFWLLMPILSRQTFTAYNFLQKTDFSAILRKISPFSPQISADFTAAINNFVNTTATSVLSKLTSFILNLPTILLHVSVIIFTLFFALRDGKELVEYVKSLSPLSEKTQSAFFKHFEDITYSVLYGQVIVGISQGIVTGIGFLIFGIPNALSLTILTVFVGILPIIGPWLVWIPVDIFLFVNDQTFAGVGLLLYGAIVVTWIDSIVRPMVVSKKTNINSGIVLVGMIGGLFVFGVLGLILGPLILAYSLLILDIYRFERF